jgi:hypothetical protein
VRETVPLAATERRNSTRVSGKRAASSAGLEVASDEVKA